MRTHRPPPRAVFGWAALLWLSLLLISPFAAPAHAQGGGAIVTINQVGSDLFPTVTAYVNVTDESGLPVTGLTNEAFQVTEDGQPIEGFNLSEVMDTGETVSLVLVLDISGSMEGKPLEDTKSAAKSLVQSLNPQDQAALIAFSDTVTTVQDFTSNQADLISALDGLEADGWTALYDAAYTGIGLVDKLPAGRKAVVLLTDGGEAGPDGPTSVVEDTDVIKAAQDANVPLYTIGFFGSDIQSKVLERMAKVTGGRYFEAPTADELTQSFQDIATLLHHQYVFAFESTLPADDASHTLVVRLDRPPMKGEDDAPFTARRREVVVTLSNPQDGAEVGGMVNLEVDFSVPAAVNTVEYSLDDDLLATVTASPYTYEWDSSTVATGSHTLQVQVTDSAGNVGEAQVSIVVRQPVVVSITAPADGDQVVDEVPISVEVDAMNTVAKVEFWWDGELLATDEAAPYEYTHDVRKVVEGKHALAVKAYDILNYSDETSLALDVRVRPTLGGLWIAVVAVVVVFALIIPLAALSRRRTRAPAAPATVPSPAGPQPRRGPSRAWLVVQRGSRPGQRFPLHEGEITLGRSRRDNVIALEGRTASRRHAVIRGTAGQFVYYDMTQTNPTVINGQEIRGPHELVEGDRIEVGDMILIFTTKEEKR